MICIQSTPHYLGRLFGPQHDILFAVLLMAFSFFFNEEKVPKKKRCADPFDP